MLGEMDSPGPSKVANRVMQLLDDRKATDIRCLDVAHLTSMMDFMIVATARSDRHLRSLGDALTAFCKEQGIEVLGTEGREAGQWLLVDLVDVVVHIMLERTRGFYDIEKLWDISLRDDDANRGHFGVP
jgi:ribosome-associated protein